MPTMRTFVVVFAVGLSAMQAQTAAESSSILAIGQKIFAEKCAACHGADANGTGRAPELSDSRRLRSQSTAQISKIISNGVSTAGMPAFDLPSDTLLAIATFVHSMNSPAFENPVPGDAAAGDRFFFADGRCATCHMVQGRGKAVGPDLSSIGAEMTIAEIRESLLHPGARISPGYQSVRVELRDGTTVSGFARSRSNFDIVVQDRDGRLRPLQEHEIAAIDMENESLMPAVEEDQVQNLAAYLSRLSGVVPGAIFDSAAESSGVSFTQIAQAKPGEWLSYDGKLTGNRYSELNEINRDNANKLVVKWSSPIPHFGLEVTPLVAEGIMYVAGPNQAYALDVATGRQIWVYSRPRTPGLVGDASLGTQRGMAILGDKLFMTTDNAHLIALNRTTGKLVWEQTMPDEPQHYGSTVAPLVVKDIVIAGVSGSDWGIRGFLAAYKASTGERVWRHWTIPAKGDPGYDTWQGADPKYGGGGTWLTGSYDVDTNTLFWGTATPWPVHDDSLRGGDNLYTDCVLAIDPDTGKLKWHFQYTPHDTHAWDATEPHVLVNTTYRGVERKLMLHADRNGFFYVFDRANGERLLVKNFVPVTYADGIGADGRPRNKTVAPGEKFCPTDDPSNWNSAAYSPATNLYYVIVLEQCATMGPRGKWASVEKGQKFVRALNIETGDVVWERPMLGSAAAKRWAGILGTAGGILFYGDPNGDVVVSDERNGKVLWHLPTNEVIKASPMTYTVDGKQMIAIAVGTNIMAFGLP